MTGSSSWRRGAEVAMGKRREEKDQGQFGLRKNKNEKNIERMLHSEEICVTGVIF
uniref:Uncharacterized protein n=1 Tax=Arundo donax TaxID=35708 RepID=A0A0A8ZQM6_ARUDO